VAQQLGFTKVKATNWAEKDKQAITEFLQKLVLGQEFIHTQNPYYFIAHYILDKTKSEKDVKQYMSKYFQRYFHNI
jgi:hypothetical protein